MKKCKCWEETKRIVGWYGDQPMHKTIQICNGTREREECSCNGEESKCNFYPEKRKENKTMNTAEMWIKAQEDGRCYRTFDLFNETIFYQKDKGLFNEDGEYCPPDYFGLFDNLMDQDWEIHGGFLTKSEAEAKFNIKIVD